MSAVKGEEGVQCRHSGGRVLQMRTFVLLVQKTLDFSKFMVRPQGQRSNLSQCGHIEHFFKIYVCVCKDKGGGG